MPRRRPRSCGTRPHVARPSTVGDRCGPRVDRHQRDTARQISFRLREAARFIANRHCAARCKRRMPGRAASWRASVEGGRYRTTPHTGAQGKRADDVTSPARGRVTPPPQCEAPCRERPLERQRERRVARVRQRIVESTMAQRPTRTHRRRSARRAHARSPLDPVKPRDSARANARTARAASTRRGRRRVRAPRGTASADRRDVRGRPSRDRAAHP